MKRPPEYHRLLLLMFFLLAMGLGIILCYLQMRHAVNDDIHSRLKQAIASLDRVFEHAELAASQAEEYPGKNCTAELLIQIRSIVATIPDIRVLSMAKKNKIYCTSGFWGEAFSLNQVNHRNGSLTLMEVNQLIPAKSLIVYPLQDRSGNSVFIGIDSDYLYNVLDAGSHLYLKVGGLYLDRNGHISTSLKIGHPVALASGQFRYSVIADRAGLAGFTTFTHYERNQFIAILFVSLLLTWLFKNYLGYRNTLTFMLRKAIKHNQLKPFIQPIVKGEDSRIVGGDVLVQWEHPKLGFIPADKFISVVEKTGLIKEVTAICFNEVIRQLYEQADILPEGLFIGFNASAIDFQDDEIVTLCTRFQSRLKARVVLKITERKSIENTLQTHAVVGKLRHIGVQFSIDNFGTGYANYSYLQQFQPEFIKVDKFFTSNVGTNSAAKLVVKNLVNLAYKLNCHIIADGVEKDAQLQALRQLGIDIFTGGYFHQPIPVHDFILVFRTVSEIRK